MSVKTFVDTNILIYAYDLDAGEKHKTANSILVELWKADGGTISTQVMQEFYVNVTRKIPQPLSPAQARGILRSYAAWHVEVITPDVILLGTEIQERNTISFWDAMIVSTAFQAGATTILSEDLSHGQVIEGITIRNPFER